MSKIDALRKLLREEITHVLRQELPKILQESKASVPFTENLKRQVDQKVPGTLNQRVSGVKAPVLKGGNILNTMLSETAATMNQRDYSFIENTEVNGLSAIQNYDYEVENATSVNDMLSSSSPSSAHEMVQINAVPDFNNLMEKMMSKGVM
ncbi:MAG: hypothetical protein EBZ69_10055 [Alphaproteobacteria bacterium]|nr:hypothetical protein [Alphaproteobacteria bacterium]